MGDSLGGDTKCTGLVALSVPITWPFQNDDRKIDNNNSNNSKVEQEEKEKSGFPRVRAFVFANAGSLGNSNYWRISSASLAVSPPVALTSPLAATTTSTLTSSTSTAATATSTSAVASTTSSSTSSLTTFQGLSKPLFGYVRASVGCGVSADIADAVRVEVCYSLPVVYSAQDNLRTAQIGMGLSIN